MILDIIRIIIASIVIIMGLYVVIASNVGNFRFKFVLERMQAAALSDTLGISLILIGLIIFEGFNVASLKLIIIIVLLWISSPVTSYMIVNMELKTREKNKELKNKEIKGEES
ncbi:MAG: monovalent cation/H(+) antiporter subunit G [Eubacteriales bacterium]|nr:monovalent cation/H(+) antiporter subunit G [Eubacteriales bacterium]